MKIKINGTTNLAKVVAILSTTVIPEDGVYLVERIEGFDSIKGIPHYIGHPDTKEILESLGSIPSKTKLFKGLKVGESALTFAIKQGLSNRGKDSFSSPHQTVTIDMLDVRLITRYSLCSGYSEPRGVKGRIPILCWHCGNCGGT